MNNEYICWRINLYHSLRALAVIVLMLTSLTACKEMNSNLPAPPVGYIPKECGVIIPYTKEFEEQVVEELGDMQAKGLYPATRNMLHDYKTTRDDIRSCVN